MQMYISAHKSSRTCQKCFPA